MEKKSHKIDDYFREHLGDHEPEAAGNLWRKVAWKLFLQKYRWYSIILLIPVIAFLLLFTLTDEKNETASPLHSSSFENAIAKPASNNTDSHKTAQDSPPIPETKSGSVTGREHKAKTTHSRTMADSGPAAGLNPHPGPEKAGDTESFPEQYNEMVPRESLFINRLERPEPISISQPDQTAIFANLREGAPQQQFPEGNPEAGFPDLTAAGWSAGFGFSSGLSDRKLTAGNDYAGHLELRNDAEDPVILPGARFDLRYTTGHFFLETGLGLSVYGENAGYRFVSANPDPSLSYYRNDTTWIWIIDPPEPPEPLVVSIDSTWVPVNRNFNETGVRNRYAYLEIPVAAGFRFRVGSLNLEFSPGIALGKKLYAGGKLPDPGNNTLDDLPGNNDPFRKTLYSWFIEAGLEKEINASWSVCLNPFYKQSLSSIFRDGFPVSQKFRTFGLQLGVRVKF